MTFLKLFCSVLKLAWFLFCEVLISKEDGRRLIEAVERPQAGSLAVVDQGCNMVPTVKHSVDKK